MLTFTVYQIRHVESGRCYVGHTARQRQRFSAHLSMLRKGKHHSPHLQRAWDKYGAEAFVIEVIETCHDAQKALEREQHFIDTLDSVFNYARVAGTRLGVPQPPEEVERVRQMMLGNSYTKGRVHPEEEKARRGAFHKGRKRSDETRQRISEGNKGVSRGLGHAVSTDTRAKIKAATDATRPTMLGKHHSEESKARSSATNKATMALKGNHRVGTKHTVETLAKMRAAAAVLREQRIVSGAYLIAGPKIAEAKRAQNSLRRQFWLIFGE